MVFDRGGTLVRERTGEQILHEVLHPLDPSIPPEALARAEEASRAYWREHARDLPRGQRWTPEIRRACLGATVAALPTKLDPAEVLPRLEEYWDVLRVEGLYAGVRPCLAALHAGRYASGPRAPPRARSGVFRPEVVRRGVGRYLTTVLSVEDLPWDKPDPRVFEAMAEKMGLPPSDLLFVGDDLDLDVVGPAKVGMRGCLVERPGNPLHEEVLHVANLTEVPALLTTLG